MITNLRSLSDLFRTAMKLAAACAFASAIAVAVSAQTNTFPSSGNAGVGTTAPTAPLEVKAPTSSHSSVLLNTTSTGYAGSFVFQEAGVTKASIQHNPGVLPGALLFNTNGGSSPANTSMVISAAGNVGIGTTSPQTRFDIKQSSDTFVGGLHLRRSTTNDTWALVTGTDNSLYMGYANNASGADAQSDFTVYPLVLTGSGKVGIGTASPAQKLHVVESGYNTFAAQLEQTNTSASNGLYIKTQTTNSGDAALHVASNNGSTQLISARNNGNVGIGTTTPSYKLDVNGEINATGIRINGTPISGGGGGSVTSVFGRVGVVTAAPDDYTWAQINKTTSSLADLSTRSASDLSSGTVAPARLGSGTANNTTFLRGDNSWAAITSSQWTTNGSNINYATAGNVGIGTTIPLKQLNIERTGTTSADYQLMLTAPLDHAVGNWTGINFGLDGYGGGYAKGGIIYEARDGYNRGRIHFALEANANTAGATLTNSRMTVDYGGNVGIGTTAPAYKLDVAGVINSSTGGFRFPDGSIQLTAASGGGGGSVASVFGRTGAVVATADDYTWAQINKTTSSLADLSTRSASDLSSGTVAPARLGSGTANNTTFLRGDNTWAAITSSQWTTSGSNINYATAGNVGIATANPTEKLHVTGNGKITGNLTVDGSINAKYQDLAEWVPSSEQLSAGTVVVLDTTKSNQVIASAVSYDTRVAGVISAQPGITLGEKGEGKVLVATTGRVRVKVDASRGPIQIGDLMVTSDVSGVAMKSEAVNLGGVRIHRPGTIIGKALEPLAKGSGEILVLLSLQ